MCYPFHLAFLIISIILFKTLQQTLPKCPNTWNRHPKVDVFRSVFSLRFRFHCPICDDLLFMSNEIFLKDASQRILAHWITFLLLPFDFKYVSRRESILSHFCLESDEIFHLDWQLVKKLHNKAWKGINVNNRTSMICPLHTFEVKYNLVMQVTFWWN